jgi:hypothetical protein
VEPFGENNKEKEYLGMKKSLILLLAVLLTGVAALGAQEEGPPPPPPPPEGLTFSGSVITGVRWRSAVLVTPAVRVDPNDPNSAVVTPAEVTNRFDIDSGDDYLVEGDTAALRGALNKGTYGANFGLSLNANNTQGGFWVPDRLYVSEASLWAKVLNEKLGLKAGYFGDFDYFSPVNAWSLANGAASNAVQVTAYPIGGLQIDVRFRNSDSNFAAGWNPPNWYNAEQYANNIDAGVRYVNSNFTVFAAFDNDYTLFVPGPFARANENQTDAYAYFAWTGVPKLTVGVESKFLDLTSQRSDPADATKDLGITNVTALNASYQITDAFSARLWLVAGADHFGFGSGADALLGADGFTVAADLELGYKINDALRVTLRPVFQIPNTEKTSVMNLSVKPKLEWTIGTMPYGATVNCWYMLRYYGGEEENTSYVNNGSDALFHTIAVTFGWTF